MGTDNYVWRFVAWLWLSIGALLLIGLLNGCGEEGKGKYGFVLNDETSSVTIEELDRSTEHLLAIIGGDGRKLEGLRVTIEDKPLPLDGSPGSCVLRSDGGTSYCAAGLAYIDKHRMRVFKHTDCWARTSFIHELCHFFQWWRDGESDTQHSSTAWWDNPLPVPASIEQQAFNAAVLDACPNNP